MPCLFQRSFLTEGKESMDRGFSLWLLSLTKIDGWQNDDGGDDDEKKITKLFMTT